MHHKKIIFMISILLTIELSSSGCLKEEEPALIANFSYSPKNPTTNDMIQFFDESVCSNGTIISWHWDFDATDEYTPETSSLQNPTFRYMYGFGETFTVTLTVTDDKGNKDSVSKKIKIVSQTNLPEEDDVSLEILSYERKSYGLNGSGPPNHGFVCVWIELKMTNHWHKEIYPTVGWDGKIGWGSNFYIYVNNSSHPYWGYSGIFPKNSPQKIMPGESAVWIVTFWIPSSGKEYKVKYAYLYDISHEWLLYRDTYPKEKAFWAFL
ncbi:MAG: PKD domain-containing protein [Thermoplasmata archaeon]|nr:MAG: PKD domain-containing protein [Thermoplasmata archaeon]